MINRRGNIEQKKILWKIHNTTKHCLIFMALLLIATGTTIFLNNMSIITDTTFDLIFSWHTLLIILGMLFLIVSRLRFWFLPVLLIIFGIIFLMESIFGDFSKNIWSLLLISMGIVLFIKIITPRRMYFPNRDKSIKDPDEIMISENVIKKSANFSELEINCNSKNFKGGTINLIFCSCEIDLRNAELAEGINILQINCVFSKIKIYLPKTWDISFESSGVFGSFNNKRKLKVIDNEGKSRKLIIKSEMLFGGGEILD